MLMSGQGCGLCVDYNLDVQGKLCRNIENVFRERALNENDYKIQGVEEMRVPSKVKLFAPNFS